MPDDAVTPRRPPSSRPEDGTRRNSMSMERRMSVGRRGSRISPADHAEHTEEETGVRRMSFKAEDPRKPRTSMPLPPNRINQGVCVCVCVCVCVFFACFFSRHQAF
jgi:hypothetical protein